MFSRFSYLEEGTQVVCHKIVKTYCFDPNQNRREGVVIKFFLFEYPRSKKRTFHNYTPSTGVGFDFLLVTVRVVG